MCSRCKPHVRRLGNESHGSLLRRFLARHPLKLPCAPIPGKRLLEGEGPPGRSWLALFGTQPQHQPRGHQGERPRAVHAPSVLGDWRPAGKNAGASALAW
jgi:hypothetical protein